ncbi:hypothetical protein [Alteromonas oceanisediminis]|uniref:hypothetical protein n=1 Tax=Alteromonas oceanisediminis TaxID=2836180 RepID=UPI001BD9E0F0|nr:hypothetical protein [Alteromonas oceanisediminis]MBT0586867.1 hypothetical protein [Alteromonas oceanisediminis]
MPKITSIGILLLLAFTADAKTLVDPTRPLDSTGTVADLNTATGEPLMLEAIFIHNNSRRAVINGVSLHEGESHLGALVLQVNSTSVVVEHSANGAKDVRELTLTTSGDVKTNATDTF